MIDMIPHKEVDISWSKAIYVQAILDGLGQVKFLTSPGLAVSFESSQTLARDGPDKISVDNERS